jgi:PiT family inorganic phosphate transporter
VNLAIVVIVVATALVFDFTNGFHDSANAMATSVATGAFTPRVAVGIAAVLNFAGASMSTEVAKTISSGIVDDNLVTPEAVFAGLVGAILWNLITWLLGLPSSSSHAMFGGLIGAVVVSAGMAGVHVDVIISKILLPALVAPVVAGVAALFATKCAYGLTSSSSHHAENTFRNGQRASAALVALAHGTSDGQKTMGLITLVLIAGDYQESGTRPHEWVIVAAGLAIALGTYSGGWRIMRTMGKTLVEIEPTQGFAAETASTVAILASSHLGFGLSTTHVVSGAILGSGVGRGAKVNWGVAGRMASAWLMTLPAAGVMGALASYVAHWGDGGFMLMAAVLIGGALTIKKIADRNKVDHTNVNADVESSWPRSATAVADGLPADPEDVRKGPDIAEDGTETPIMARPADAGARV